MPKPLLDRFISFIKNQQLFSLHDRLVLAVSGGLDSVVLCELSSQAGFNFDIGHCNFQLRGEESDADEIFVKSLGEKYSVRVFVKRFETNSYAAENGLSIQVAARELRYHWFDEIIAPDEKMAHVDSQADRPHYSKYLLTAHHANDNLETLLMNFFKGTGITGLKAILPKKGKIIRPLLFAKKEELIVFAKENNLTFVEDSSNASDKYTRNYFRHQLIPAIEKVFPEVEENLLRNIARFREIEELYEQAIAQHKKKLLEKKGNEIHIPVLKLSKTKPLSTVVFEIIKDVGFTPNQTQEVIGLLKSESGKYISSATHKIIKNRNWLIISPHNTLQSANILINESDKAMLFENGKIKIGKPDADKVTISKEPSTALLDAAGITFPLLLRKWKQGDYFYPLGMRKKKKLSRFFIDQKISVPDKEKTWVIESDKRIIWVVGLRIDDRFKINDKTTQVLRISFMES